MGHRDLSAASGTRHAGTDPNTRHPGPLPVREPRRHLPPPADLRQLSNIERFRLAMSLLDNPLVESGHPQVRP